VNNPTPPAAAKPSRFKIVPLEDRIAPAATGLIPSVDLSDPAVNGAEHACFGLSHNHEGDLVSYRHGCQCDCHPPGGGH
jgi:hypothetical protein